MLLLLKTSIFSSFSKVSTLYLSTSSPLLIINESFNITNLLISLSNDNIFSTFPDFKLTFVILLVLYERKYILSLSSNFTSLHTPISSELSISFLFPSLSSIIHLLIS